MRLKKIKERIMAPIFLLILYGIAAVSGDFVVDVIDDGDILDEDVECPSCLDSEREAIPEDEIEEVLLLQEKKVTRYRNMERRLASKGRIVKSTDRKSDPSVIRSRETDPKVKKLEERQMAFKEALKEIVQKFRQEDNDVASVPPSSTSITRFTKSIKNSCESVKPRITCVNNYRYRTADGRCNNLYRPTWGATFVCQRRLLPAKYFGESEFRRSVTGEPLPPPRKLSLNLHYPILYPANYVNHMYMFFGQLLDHDFAFTPASTTVGNNAIQCCPPSPDTHPQCAPILVSPNDPFYSKFGTTCINFVRSAICPTCTLGDRQMINQITSFIDASFVYGNSDNQTRSLRRNDGTGRLRTQNSAYGDLLPASSNPIGDQCSFPNTNDICFVAGDPRVNQHTALASLQTLFLREHNRIADALRILNPGWGEELIFQEARRIVGAEMQAITYKDYLPITLGNKQMKAFNLFLLDGGARTVYNPREDPTLILEFSTAAYRFGHSMINSLMAKRPLNSTNEPRLLRNEFFQPFDIYRGVLDPLMSSACYSPANRFDEHLVEDVTNYLYKIRGNRAGLDLAAFNINRGRDHGMQPYVELVRWCTGGKVVIRDFDDLVRFDLMRPKQADALKRNYRNVNDVDLWPGLLMEIPNVGAVVGPTTACIIGLQFRKMKFGDRFYFEHRDQVGSFTYQQLQELRKVRLSTIMCLNSNVKRLPRNAMLFKSKSNPLISCKYQEGIDLSYWKE